MIITSYPIILASTSSIRKFLMEKTGISFRCEESSFDEEMAKSTIGSLSFEERAKFLARGKALAVSKISKDAYVIGGDQVCVLESEGKIFSKPKTRERAIAQLSELSGKMHTQISGISICYDGEEIWSHHQKTYVSMRKLTQLEIEHYIDLDQPFMAAGSYQLESHAKHLFTEIIGTEDNVLGLPIVPILNFFYERQIISL